MNIAKPSNQPPFKATAGTWGNSEKVTELHTAI